MKEIRVDEAQKLSDILEILKSEGEDEIEITNPNAPVFQAGLNREVLITAADSLGKKLKFRETAAAQVEKTPEVKENLGFVEGKDVAEEKPPEQAVAVEKKKTPFIKIPKIKGPKWLYAVVVVLLIAVLGAISLLAFLPKATVDLQTTTQFKEAQLAIVASSTAQSADVNKAVVPLKQVEVTEEDSIEESTTGTKETGTPAKGKVSIINHDVTDGFHDGSKTFFAGTVLVPISGGSTQFTLDQAATVLASPAACTDNCEQVSADVTAKVIGEAGNLPADTVFKIGDASVSIVSAKILTNFSGGTSKQIKIVSASDQKKASDDLLKKLSDKAIRDLKSKNPGIIIPDGAIENQILQQTYSSKVGDEAQSFKLTMQVKFVAKVVSEDDLKKVLGKAVLENSTSDFKLDDKNTVVTSQLVEKNGNDLKLLGKIKASLSPNLDEDAIKGKIAGKKFSEVEGYLKSLNSVSGFEIKIEPSIFTFLQRLPYFKDKIKIQISQKS